MHAPVHSAGDIITLRNVGARLAELRERRGLTQGELARMAGAAQSSISLIESRQRIPSLPTLIRLADILQADVCLCDREENEKD